MCLVSSTPEQIIPSGLGSEGYDTMSYLSHDRYDMVS